MLLRARRRAHLAITAAVLLTAMQAPAGAMPIFAKAYGVHCSLCHTIVPALNSYGRYVQRSGYASLDRDVLKSVPPFWIGEQLNGDSTGGVSELSPNATNSPGNLALHGAGYLAPDWTFHAQQWLLQNDATGGTLDTMWVTYNNLLHRDGHLFIGKYEAPAPSPYSQWFDISAFALPEMVVGEHAYELDANRWGAKLAYTPGAFDLEAGYEWSGNGLPGASDFAIAPGTDKTLQWKAAWDLADQPLEAGVYGSSGSYIVSTNAIDRYTSIAPYIELDPGAHGVPGLFVVYQTADDTNPGLDANGNQLPRARSTSFTGEIYEPLFQRNAMLSLRSEYANDGLGNIAHYGVIDLAFNVPHSPYLHAYVEAGLNANSTAPNGGPTWRWLVWWTAPL